MPVFDYTFWILPAILATSFLAGVITFLLKEEQANLRAWLNMLAAAVKAALVIAVMDGFFRGDSYEMRFSLALGFDFLLRIDALSLLLTALSTFLWFLTTLYAIGYMKGSENLPRFFGFFSMCVTASVGVAIAGNLITFFIFYEFLTLATYPLVVHKGTERAVAAGRTYIWYTLTGGSVLFIGIVWLYVLSGPVDFTPGGVVAGLVEDHPVELTAIFVIMMLGLGVKAALTPLHGWLPVAMIAPAPVSALLHAVAVVKAGAFGIVRVIYDVFGVGVSAALGLLTPLAVIAAITIIYGSLRALGQDELKKRLAYSTVSQLSYITLGAAIPGLMSTTGSLVHLIHQGVMKITLFFCAGAIQVTMGMTRISEMSGLGRRMPVTCACFTIGAFGMIGAPPTAGFISKWHLGVGAVRAGHDWVILVLLVSSALNAAYFLPIVRSMWFGEERRFALEASTGAGRREAHESLLIPMILTALCSLLFGLFAAWPLSPLEMARVIAESLYITE